MSNVGFALRADHENFVGGSIAYGPTCVTFDVKEALDRGKGVIVTDDSLLVSALDNYPAVKRTQVPKGARKAKLPDGAQSAVDLVEPDEQQVAAANTPAAHADDAGKKSGGKE